MSQRLHATASVPTSAVVQPPKRVVLYALRFGLPGERGKLREVENASFRLTDPPALVEASLSCPVCLHAVTWEASGEGAQPFVHCRCLHCDHGRKVLLTAVQRLRLELADDDDERIFAGRGASWRQLFLLL